MPLKPKGLALTLKLIRIAYLVSIVSLLASGLLIYINRKTLGAWETESFQSVFVWFSALFVMWTMMISIPILLIISMYQVTKGKFKWHHIKKEVILLLITFGAIFLMLLLLAYLPNYNIVASF